ncbi:MAG: SPOR domain-containing protein [Candidatus Aquirickettsiella sp.]
MDFSFKRISLIITIVIAALLVIFVPLCIKDHRSDSFSLLSFTIPSLPVAPSASLLSMTSTTPKMKNLLSFPLTPAKAWVVELPDIKDPAEAENLVQTLRRKGFNAYSRQYKSLLGVLTRVFVGPEIKPEQMHQVAKKLNTELHLTTQLVPFDPLLSE